MVNENAPTIVASCHACQFLLVASNIFLRNEDVLPDLNTCTRVQFYMRCGGVGLLACSKYLMVVENISLCSQSRTVNFHKGNSTRTLHCSQWEEYIAFYRRFVRKFNPFTFTKTFNCLCCLKKHNCFLNYNNKQLHRPRRTIASLHMLLHSFLFLLVPRQLLPVPDLKLMEILFRYFDPLSSWSSSWSCPGDTSYHHLFCYSLFWKSL